ncbi:MAG: FkbM family methyltransferase [Planctomycetota bacterium]
MRNYAGQVLSDAWGLSRTCGLSVGVSFIWNGLMSLPAVVKRRSMQPVAERMGPGPFTARLRGYEAKLFGRRIVNSVTEIWVRDVYTGGGFLSFPKGATVLDLGANRGVFTMLALSSSPTAEVTAVEVDPKYNDERSKMLELNGWGDRLRLVPAFIGPPSPLTDELVAKIRACGHPAEVLTEGELLERMGAERIDFVKCDIEGSEYGLLHEQSELLRRTDRLAIELHTNVGDGDGFIAMLERLGFETRVVHRIGETILLNARRPGLG